MKALVFERNLPRFAASRLASRLGSGKGAAIGPLRLLETDPPELPASDWVRVTPLLSGICGSDLATLDAKSSRYFEHIVSFPFVPGHEVVGELDSGARVVLEPVLGCVARGIDPPCDACRRGMIGDCERIAFGNLAPGLQTGYCADTGGGWSHAGLVAHPSQLHVVPDALSDEDAVVVEPVACAVHAVCDAGLEGTQIVAVLGAGTLGLAVVAAVTTLSASGRIPTPGALLVGARYSHQRRLATELGAASALSPDQLVRAVRRQSGSLSLSDPRPGHASGPLTGGAHVVFDCVGSAGSIAQCLEMVRPRGRVVLVGMPGRVHVDLAPLWQREVRLAGAYAYGTEVLVSGERVRTFDLAFDVVAAHGLGRLVSAAYPIERFEEAVQHAGAAGRRGAVKVAFDLRRGSERRPVVERHHDDITTTSAGRAGRADRASHAGRASRSTTTGGTP
ncbi:MAG: zinc-binding dehydrogenase [Actinomycetota bacterium]|nr:zinc-binding dehydrogenase [Actinomycetota bacterium]